MRRNRIRSRNRAFLDPISRAAILLMELFVYRPRSPVYRVTPFSNRDLAAHVKMLGHSRQRDSFGSLNFS
jgi:hypothetical protein